MKKRRIMSAKEREFEKANKSRILAIINNQTVVDFDAVDENNDTLLHAICKYFTVKEIAKLMKTKEGFQKNLKDSTSHCLVEKKLRYIVRNLTNSTDGLKKCKNNGDYITHVFIELAYESEGRNVSGSFIEWLISEGFDFDMKNSRGKSALHLAIEYHLEGILPLLFKRTKDVHYLSENNETLLHLFLANRRKGSFIGPIVKILLDRGVNVDVVNNSGLTALHMAVNSCESTVVAMILERTSKLTENLGLTMLHQVIRIISCGPVHFKILRMLIDKGVDVNSKDVDGYTPLHYALNLKNLNAVVLLMRNGIRFDVEYLHHALAYKPKYKTIDDSEVSDLFDILVNKGCNANSPDDYGQTPLHWACETGNVTIVKKLLAHGVDLHPYENISGWTPLHTAAASEVPQSKEVVGLLLDHGAQVNRKDLRCCRRPLHVATIARNSAGVLMKLLEGGALANARDRDGNSALHLEISNRSMDRVQALIDYGADINDECVTRLLPRYWKGDEDKILMRHWIKLKTAGLSCSDEYKMYIRQMEHGELFENCSREIGILKRTFIDDRMSVYGWLRANPNKRYVNGRHEKLKVILDSQTFQQQFPQYSSVVRGFYWETIGRKPLLQLAKEAWMKQVRIYLPDICIDCVLSYLNSGDLLNIIEMDECNKNMDL